MTDAWEAMVDDVVPDRIDLALIDQLQQDGTLSLEKLREGLLNRGITRPGDVPRRVKRLKEAGLIHISAVLDYERIGLPVVSLVFVKVARGRHRTMKAALDEFEELVRGTFPSIILSHKVEGEWSYVLKMLSRDKLHFDQLHAALTALEAVEDISTMSVIGQFKALVPVNLIPS